MKKFVRNGHRCLYQPPSFSPGHTKKKAKKNSKPRPMLPAIYANGKIYAGFTLPSVRASSGCDWPLSPRTLQHTFLTVQPSSPACNTSSARRSRSTEGWQAALVERDLGAQGLQNRRCCLRLSPSGWLPLNPLQLHHQGLAETTRVPDILWGYSDTDLSSREHIGSTHQNHQ